MNRNAGAMVLMMIALVSAVWGYLEQRAYWVTVSMLAVAWSVWAMRASSVLEPFTLSSMAALVGAVPVIGSVFGSGNSVLLESVAAPILLYLLCIGVIMPTIGENRTVGSRGAAYLTAIAPISIGAIILLALYHLNNGDVIGWLDGNSHFMWNLGFLFLLSVVLALVERKIGLLSTTHQQRRAEG